MKKTLVACSILVFLAGCPQAVPVVQATEQCVEDVIIDALNGLTIDQIVQKDGSECATAGVTDIETIVTILLNSNSEKVRTTQAYKDAYIYRAGHQVAARK
jgi:hypothetical protein